MYKNLLYRVLQFLHFCGHVFCFYWVNFYGNKIVGVVGIGARLEIGGGRYGTVWCSSCPDDDRGQLRAQAVSILLVRAVVYV